MTRDAITPVTDGQVDSILRLIQEAGKGEVRGLDKNGGQFILERGGEFKAELMRVMQPVIQRFSTAPNIVVVPDMPAVELIALAKKDLSLTYLDSDYATWDFHISFDGKPVEGRGKRFEVMVWKPELGRDDSISAEAVREHFRKFGFHGHAAAFTQWRRQNADVMGYHATLPKDCACWRSPGGGLYVPTSGFDAVNRWLRNVWLGDGWGDDWSFVAFRELLS